MRRQHADIPPDQTSSDPEPLYTLSPLEHPAPTLFLCAGNGLDESWRKYSGCVRKYLARYVRLLAEHGDGAALAAAAAYLHTRTSWAFNFMPDLARCAGPKRLARFLGFYVG